MTAVFTEIKSHASDGQLMAGRLGGAITALGMLADAQRRDRDAEGGFYGVAGFYFLRERAGLTSEDGRFLRQLDYVASVAIGGGLSDDDVADAVEYLARAFAQEAIAAGLPYPYAPQGVDNEGTLPEWIDGFNSASTVTLQYVRRIFSAMTAVI